MKYEDIACPHCGDDYEGESNDELVTCWGDDGPLEVICADCGKSYWADEFVERTYVVTKERPPE